MIRILAALCATLAIAGPAAALELRDQRLDVSFKYAGVDHHLGDARVPLLPSNACYGWEVQLPEGVTPTSVVERLILPVPLADWGDLATNPDDGVDISTDGMRATSTLAAAPDAEGWLYHGWCVAEGDPTGTHRFEIDIDGATAASFVFEVQAPEDYEWPAIAQPDPMARSVYMSW